MNFVKLTAFLETQKQPAYRLKQVKEVYFEHLGESWESVTSWPKALREAAEVELPWDVLNQDMVQQSSAGDTTKFLFSCADGSKVETVLMSHDYHDGRETVCISCQVGCPMGCAFCATGTMGFIRNLTSEEIVEQAVRVARFLKTKDKRVNNVVYMGMGEPMHNYDNVMDSIRQLNDPKGLAIGVRHISISTCGIVPGILKLADEPLRVNLAISLHSAIDEVRSNIMPVNRAYPIKKLMKAVDIYLDKTNRKVLFEYVMLKGINDRREDAHALAVLLQDKPHLYHVNVIKYHDTGIFKHTEEEGRDRFIEWLREEGVLATHRRNFGEDIDAACGQLASAEEDGERFEGLEAAKKNRKQKKEMRN
jgi:23S rRNA (adenine2503-C2)-methyltransferase